VLGSSRFQKVLCPKNPINSPIEVQILIVASLAAVSMIFKDSI
jgi:hypothetical protein